MIHRRHWLIAGMTCLLAGCLLHNSKNTSQTSGVLESPQSTSPLLTESEIKAAPQPPSDTLSPLSDYGPRCVSLRRETLAKATDESPQRVKLQMGTRPAATESASPKDSAATSQTASEPILPPTTKEAPLLTAFRHVIEKDPEKAQQLLEQTGKGDRELLLGLVQLTAELSQHDLDEIAPEQVGQILEQLRQLSQHLQKRAPLQVARVCLCRRIDGFGQYELMPEDHVFQAGIDQDVGDRIQVYAEVKHHSSRMNQGLYETVLASTLEIYNEQRQKVVTLDVGECVDRSQTPRQDYFLNYQFHVPAKLPPGLYTLWVQIQDKTLPENEATGKRIARRSVDFRVGSPQPRSAATNAESATK